MKIDLDKTVSIVLVLVFSVTVQSFSFAKKKTDSLLQRLALVPTVHQAPGSDTTRANMFILIAEELVKDGDYDRAEECAGKALKVADSLLLGAKFSLWSETVKARALLTLAKVSSGRNNYNQAIDFCGKTLLVCANIDNQYPGQNATKSLMGNAYNTMGANYYFLSTLDKALEAYLKALKIFEELGDSKKIISVSNNTGLIHQQKGDSKKALEYYRNALSISEKEQDKRNIASSCNNIGGVYLSDGDVEADNGYPQGAEEYYNNALPFFLKALKFNKETGNEIWQAFNYSNIGHIFEKKNNFDSALAYYLLALKIRDKVGEKRGSVFSHQNVGSVFLKQGKIALAKEQFLMALNMATRLKTKEQIMAACLALSECENKTGNYKKAYQYHLSYSFIKDSILNEKSNRQIAEMQTRFETEKKEKENITLKQRNAMQQLLTKHEEDKRKTQLVFSIVTIVLLTVGAVVVYKRRQSEQKAVLATELSRQEKLRFVAILEAEEKERVRIAKELHDSLGQMLSVARLNVSSLNGSIPANDQMALNNSLKIIDDACDEVRTISHNMMPAALIRLGLVAAVEGIIAEINLSEKITASFITNIEHRFSESKEITIYRIIQEVLNNILKHAAAKKIEITLNKSNEEIELTIKDDGKGFDVATISSAKGLGWRNIHSRTAMLNGEIEVTSSQTDGTTIKIVFPSRS